MPPRIQARRAVSVAVGVYVAVLLSLQIFLLTVALDAALGDEPGIAWVSAVTSVVLAAGSGLFYRYVRAPR